MQFPSLARKFKFYLRKKGKKNKEKAGREQWSGGKEKVKEEKGSGWKGKKEGKKESTKDLVGPGRTHE